MSEELNVVGYLHKNSVGVRILSREATIIFVGMSFNFRLAVVRFILVSPPFYRVNN